MRKIVPLLLFFGVLLSIGASVAQTAVNVPSSNDLGGKNLGEKWEAGMFVGASFYSGDLSTGHLRVNSGGGSGGFFARYHLNDHWAGRANLQFGGFKGSDKNFESKSHRDRNFSFSSSFYDFGLLMEVEPFAKIRMTKNPKSNYFLSPYFHTGLSGVLTVPLVDFNEPNAVAEAVDIRIDKSNATFFHPTFPVGMGIRVDLNSNWMIAAETGVRKVFTDYLDGISRAGNPSKKDWIYAAGLILGYRFAEFRDKDGDGLPDDKDACPMDAGTRKTMGCPDGDGDGVADKTDICPDVKGVILNAGCPESGTAVVDGFSQHILIPDKKVELKSAGSADSIVIDVKGKKWSAALQKMESEKDQFAAGSLNDDMACRSIMFVLENSSSAAVSDDETTKLLSTAEEMIIFNKGKSELLIDAGKHLQPIAEMLVRQQNYRLLIICRTQESGNGLQDVLLSVARARSVYTFLRERGVDFRRLSYVGSGSKCSDFTKDESMRNTRNIVPYGGK